MKRILAAASLLLLVAAQANNPAIQSELNQLATYNPELRAQITDEDLRELSQLNTETMRQVMNVVRAEGKLPRVVISDRLLAFVKVHSPNVVRVQGIDWNNHTITFEMKDGTRRTTTFDPAMLTATLP